MKKLIFLILIIIIVVGVFLFLKKPSQVCFNNTCFKVEATDDIAKGLMYREKMEADHGMLFIFPTIQKHSFWMKNTLIPLDIIWLDEKKEVVFIAKNAQPCTEECSLIIPDKNAKYVLEINTGIIDVIMEDKAKFK